MTIWSAIPKRRAGGIVYFRQPRRPRFQPASRPPCRMTPTTVGWAIWRFRHHHRRGVTYSERASFPDDELHTAGASRGTKFRFE